MLCTWRPCWCMATSDILAIRLFPCRTAASRGEEPGRHSVKAFSKNILLGLTWKFWGCNVFIFVWAHYETCPDPVCSVPQALLMSRRVLSLDKMKVRNLKGCGWCCSMFSNDFHCCLRMFIDVYRNLFISNITSLHGDDGWWGSMRKP